MTIMIPTITTATINFSHQPVATVTSVHLRCSGSLNGDTLSVAGRSLPPSWAVDCCAAFLGSLFGHQVYDNDDAMKMVMENIALIVLLIPRPPFLLPR